MYHICIYHIWCYQSFILWKWLSPLPKKWYLTFEKSLLYFFHSFLNIFLLPISLPVHQHVWSLFPILFSWFSIPHLGSHLNSSLCPTLNFQMSSHVSTSFPSTLISAPSAFSHFELNSPLIQKPVSGIPFSLACFFKFKDW